jgi:hypothetical protein
MKTLHKVVTYLRIAEKRSCYRRRRRVKKWVSILAKTPSTWQVAIQGHIFLPKARYSTQLDVNQTFEIYLKG